MPINPAAALIGGVIGWVIRGKGAQPEPVDVPSAIEYLRARKPKTYDVLTFDMSVARANQEVVCVGDWLAITNINSTVDLEVRLNETEWDALNLSRLRTIKQLYYRLFLTNTAGAGSVQLFCSLGGEFYPPEATQVDVTSDPVLLSGTLAGRPTASLNNRLFWAADVQILYRDTGSEWLAMLSTVISGTLATRPAASLLDRYFWATGENILYHDTGSAWEKAGVADHAAAHQPGGGDAMAVDAAAGTGSLRTIGGGAQQSAPGNHSHEAQQIFIPSRTGAPGIGGRPRATKSDGYAVVSFRDDEEETWTMSGFFPYVPSSVKLVVLSTVAGDVRIAIASDFGAVGEDWHANTDSIAEASYTLSADTFAEIDVTAAFTNAAALDYFGIEITRDGKDVNDTTNSDLYLLGILITP